MRYFALFWSKHYNWHHFKSNIEIFGAYDGVLILDSNTLCISNISFEDFLKSETDIERDERNYKSVKEFYDFKGAVLKHIIESEHGLYPVPVRKLFLESVSNVIREYRNDFVIVPIGDTNLMFWCEYLKFYCNDIKLFELTSCTENLWLRQNPIVFTYRPNNGILILKLGLVDKTSNSDQERNIDLVICIDEVSKKVVSVHNCNKDRMIFCRGFVGDAYIKQLCEDDSLLNDVIEGNIRML